MEKIVTQVCLTRFGLRRWENKVNALLEDGWQVESFSVDKKFFKVIAWAWLVKEPTLEVATEADNG